MQTTLAATALLMGLAGGPHCVAMCGAACAGIARTAPSARSLWIFQAGRVIGYSALGGVAAASMQGLGWLSIQSAALRPIWTLFHVAAALLGLMLLWQARQPVWLENSARTVWRSVQTVTHGMTAGAAPMTIGVLWSLLPCGLLYSALLVAAMSGNALEGAAVMALFALGSGISLMVAPWLWLRMRSKDHGAKWAIRIAGLALFATSGWALWMGLAHDTAPWCITP